MHIHPFDIFCVNYGIEHKLISHRTPRHNGKVEQSHKNDNERFYKHLKLYSYGDLIVQMKGYLYKSHKLHIQVLNYLIPIEMIQKIVGE